MFMVHQALYIERKFRIHLRVVLSLFKSVQEEQHSSKTPSLKKKLLEREYESTVVEAGIKKAREMTREEALQRAQKNRKSNRDENAGRQHRFITEFDRRTGPRLKQVLEDNYNQLVDRDCTMKGYFPNKPTPTFTRGKNLRVTLPSKITAK